MAANEAQQNEWINAIRAGNCYLVLLQYIIAAHSVVVYGEQASG